MCSAVSNTNSACFRAASIPKERRLIHTMTIKVTVGFGTLCSVSWWQLV